MLLRLFSLFKCLKSLIPLDIQKIHLGLDRMGWIFLFLGAIFSVMTMISNENRVKAYMIYLILFCSWQALFYFKTKKF